MGVIVIKVKYIELVIFHETRLLDQTQLEPDLIKRFETSNKQEEKIGKSSYIIKIYDVYFDLVFLDVVDYSVTLMSVVIKKSSLNTKDIWVEVQRIPTFIL